MIVVIVAIVWLLSGLVFMSFQGQGCEQFNDWLCTVDSVETLRRDEHGEVYRVWDRDAHKPRIVVIPRENEHETGRGR